MGVVIAGAGPTGLTLACALLQRGVPVDIVDSATGPATTSRALGLQPRGVEVLDRVGALGDLCERGIKAMSATVYTGDRPILSLQLGRLSAKGRSVLLISQAEIEAQLRCRLGELGGHIEWGTPLVDAKVDHNGVAVTVGTEPRKVHADWLVGCDGAHSTVRKLAGIDFPGAPIVERILLADVHADLPISREGTAVWLHRDGMLAAFPLPGEDLWRLFAEVSTEESDVLAQLSRLVQTRTSMTGARIGPAEWTSTFQIQRRIASHYRRGRILLAGDAAHIHSPLGGQGLNTGIGDAENLAWKLVLVAKGIAGDQLLDTYEAERRPVAKDVVAGTTAGTQILLGANAAARWLRDRLILPVLNRPIVRDRLLAVASQLSVSYRRGPLAPKIQMPIGLRPGDRVPDLSCHRPDGTATSLHRELAGRWAVVAPDGGDPPPISQLGDELIALWGPVSDTLLIRPDAHLAWRQRYATVGLPTWLDNILGENQPSRR
ncbi:MAG TPA: FAD-dependent monooxygenase [Mycobacterium sp.]|nr:FAD-dependent monooxygenase [Mycobacterium sp.]HUH67914.1 FAD-dependent monooxygenase [Mycobacterium sp.]